MSLFSDFLPRVNSVFPVVYHKIRLISILLVLVATSCSSSDLPDALTPTQPLSSSASTPASGNPTSIPCFYTYYDPFAFLPGSQKLMVRARGGIQIFNLESMREHQFITAPTYLDGPTLALSPDGTQLAWALEGGTVQRVRLSNLQIDATMRTRQSGPLKLEFSPDGKLLYSASHSGIKVWTADGTLLHDFQPGGEIVNFSLSPDGSLLALIPFDGPLTLWSMDDFQLVRELGGSGGYDTSDAVFSPDGMYLAADLAAGLFLWRLEDGAELLGAEDAINSLAVTYSPDGRYLAYSDLDQLVLTSPDGSHIIRTLSGHRSPVFSLVFSPDGSRLVSADDLEIRVWDLEAGQLLAVGSSACP